MDEEGTHRGSLSQLDFPSLPNSISTRTFQEETLHNENSTSENRNSTFSEYDRYIQSAIRHLRNETNIVGNGGNTTINIQNFNGNLLFNHGEFKSKRNTEELRFESQDLLGDFLQHKLRSENVSDIPNEIHLLLNEDNIQRASKSMEHFAQILREHAEEFDQSPARRRVRSAADEFLKNIQNYSSEDIREFFNNIFVDGRNPWGRVVTLFTFCGDIIIAALKKKVFESVKKIIIVVIKLIIDKVCTFVAEHGGWGAVLEAMNIKKYIIPTALVVSALIAGGVYFFKGK